MWNNLRARHYSVLILLAIVALETSAIAIDRFINCESDVAFTVESPFQNNSFIQSFRAAEASCAVLPLKFGSVDKSTHSAVAPVTMLPKNNSFAKVAENSVSAEFIAADEKPSFTNLVEYSVQPGDSLSNIAVLFGSKADTIKSVNRIDDKHNIMAGQTIKVPMPADGMLYTVKKGDSLSRIAGRFKVQLKDIVEENNLKSHMLVADQKIRIPLVDRQQAMKIVKSTHDMTEVAKKLEVVRENKKTIVSQPGLALIKVEKVQMAAAPAVKPVIKFIDKELLNTPPVIVKAPDKAIARAVASVVEKPAEPVANTDAAEVAYTVVKGDSLLKIANHFNTTVAQLQADNNMKNHFLKVGQELRINPDKKMYRLVKAEPAKKASTSQPSDKVVEHKVKSGDSLSAIARKYKTTISAIVAENNLSNTVVMAGQTVKVPVSEAKDFKVIQGNSKVSRAAWKMPVRGRLSDAYGWRNHPVYRKRLFHAGIDIAAPKGSPIAAASGGRVIYAGRRSGYGNLVIVSHANGYSTRYAHCSRILVKKGQQVKAGQLIARVGATGVATGNHLHFELRKNGKTQNPLTFLR